MENLVIKGIITATSKKNNDETFKQEVPTKTAFVSTDEENAKKLEEFGLTKYTTKEGNDYFIIKFPANLMIYLPNGFGKKRPDLSQVYIKDFETSEYQETNNFKTPDDKVLLFNIIKGRHKNNDFFRLQAIKVDTEEDIQEILPENPFGDGEAF